MENQKNKDLKDLLKNIVESYKYSNNILCDERVCAKILKTANTGLEAAQGLEEAFKEMPPDIARVRNEAYRCLIDNLAMLPDGIDEKSLLDDQEFFQSRVLPSIKESISKFEDIINIYSRIKEKLINITN